MSEKERQPDLKFAKAQENGKRPPMKVLLEYDGKQKVKILGTGRNALIYSSPSYRDERKRGKAETEHLSFEGFPEDVKRLGRGKRYLIYTWGCQMNVHDSEVMAGILEEMGYTPAEEEKEADLILFNTCAVRENAEDKVFGELGRLKVLKLEKPGLILGLAGCMSQEETVVNKILRSYPHVDLVFGTHNIHRLPILLREALFGKEMVIEVWNKEGDIVENLPKQRRDGLKAWVNIMYGCDEFCTYCIVPYTRGKERSRRPEEILAEVRDLARRGYQEITLLGQNVNAYGKDFTDRDYNFADLLSDIHKIDIPWVRFTTSHPRDFDDRLIDVLAQGGNLLEHVHLPVQSGSNRILKRMNRKYTREEYLDLVRRMKERIPGLTLTTDIIVGFPGETEEDFQETLRLVEEVGYDAAFTFIYSPRAGTPAARMEDNVSEEEKKERLNRLNELLAKQGRKKNESLKGRVVEVLVEGESKKDPTILSGRTRNNKLVHFRGAKEWTGRFIRVRITEPKTWVLMGEAVEEGSYVHE
ncbi:enzyme for ms(2)i(6)A formation for tRNA modification [[Clostridium] ultunense Esp]|nr:enzyme for ms(2)i(6)A formation for tRNA modification [[Clostridium] ultunense Esp]